MSALLSPSPRNLGFQNCHISSRIKMSTHHEGHPTHKRQRRRSQHSLPHHQHALRLLAPKGSALPCHPERLVQRRRQLGHSNIQDQQPTGCPDPANDVNLQQSETSPSCIRLEPVSYSHGFTLSPFLQPGRAFLGLERKHYSPCPETYSNSMLLTSAGDGFPEENPFSGVITGESHGLSTHNLTYDNLQVQEAIQSQHGEDHFIPMLDAPKDPVWAAMEQSIIDVHQGQCSISFSDSMALRKVRTTQADNPSDYMYRSIRPIHY